MDNAGFVEQLLGTRRSVEFDWQGRKGKQRARRKDSHPDPGNIDLLQDKPDHDQDPAQVRADIDSWHQHRADFHREVFLGILQGVSQFMCGDRDGRYRGTVCYARRKEKCLVARVIVVGELPGCALYLHTIQITGGDQSLRCLMTGESTGGTDLAPLIVRVSHIPGSEAHQRERRDHKTKIHRIKEKHRSLLSKDAK